MYKPFLFSVFCKLSKCPVAINIQEAKDTKHTECPLPAVDAENQPREIFRTHIWREFCQLVFTNSLGPILHVILCVVLMKLTESNSSGVYGTIHNSWLIRLWPSVKPLVDTSKSRMANTNQKKPNEHYLYYQSISPPPISLSRVNSITSCIFVDFLFKRQDFFFLKAFSLWPSICFKIRTISCFFIKLLISSKKPRLKEKNRKAAANGCRRI